MTVSVKPLIIALVLCIAITGVPAPPTPCPTSMEEAYNGGSSSWCDQAGARGSYYFIPPNPKKGTYWCGNSTPDKDRFSATSNEYLDTGCFPCPTSCPYGAAGAGGTCGDYQSGRTELGDSGCKTKP